MRALAIDRYGKDAPLTLRELPPPAVGPEDVLIEVHAASVNPVDFKTRDGALKLFLKYRFPLVLGMDLSGVVREVGASVRRWKPGDEVFVRLAKQRIGAFAELAVAHMDLLAPKPRNLSHVEAASLPLVGLTSLQALVELGQLQRGQKALITAGAGGVGTFAIQLAKHLGATVVTTASSASEALVRGLGADQVIDYKTTAFETVVHDADLVFDTQGGPELLRCFRALRPGGVVVSISGLPDDETARALGINPILRFLLYFARMKIRRAAKKAKARWRYLFMRPDGAQLAELGALVEQGAIRPVVAKVYSLERGAEAMAEVEAGRAKGKVVIAVR